jgi:hypothetical protein
MSDLPFRAGHVHTGIERTLANAQVLAENKILMIKKLAFTVPLSFSDHQPDARLVLESHDFS